jgi:hypothetical protein
MTMDFTDPATWMKERFAGAYDDWVRVPWPKPPSPSTTETADGH